MKTIKPNNLSVSERAAIEARRGVVRDNEGRIIRSKEWLKERITLLEEKIADFKTRATNAKAEIKERQAQLESGGKE